MSTRPKSDGNLGGVHVTQPYGQNGHQFSGLAEPTLETLELFSESEFSDGGHKPQRLKLGSCRAKFRSHDP